jgi:hypothetical protein
MPDSQTGKSEYIFRPLGLTIGILAAFVLFGFWQIIKFYIAYRLNAGQGNFIVGGFPYDTWTKAGGIAGVLIMTCAIFAWMGKPSFMRWGFQILVLVSGFLLIGESFYRLYGPTDIVGMGSLNDVASDTAKCLIPTQLGTLIYVLWFMNRAPARAFYTQTPLEKWQGSTAHKPTEVIEEE